MLSRFYHKTFQLQKTILKPQIPCVNASTSKSVAPTESSERDLVNFPRMVRAEYAPETRCLVIPYSWFKFFYPKTGVTGPYMFMTGLVTFLFSKEYLILESMPELAATFCLALYVQTRYGDKVAAMYNKIIEERTNMCNGLQEKKKDSVKNEMKALEESKFSVNVIDEIIKAKRENILLQMENVYRERLVEVNKKVNTLLNYHVEMQNLERRISHRNLVDYVTSHVLKSITPEQEKNTLQHCINDLNSLSAKA